MASFAYHLQLDYSYFASVPMTCIPLLIWDDAVGFRFERCILV